MRRLAGFPAGRDSRSGPSTLVRVSDNRNLLFGFADISKARFPPARVEGRQAASRFLPRRSPAHAATAVQSCRCSSNASAKAILVVTRIDRLARSMKDLQDIVHELRGKGAALKATEQPIDTSSAAGKALLDMPGVFAEFKTNLRRERQLEGIAKAKAEGVFKGRKPSIDVAKVKALRESGMGPAAIAKQLKMARSSVYRVLEGH